VVVPAVRVDESVRALGGLSGVEVHHVHAESGRIIVVLESASLAEQEQGLVQIRGLPGVILAEPVYHYRDSEPADPRPTLVSDAQERGR